MIVQVAPMTIINPPSTKIEKLTVIRPNSQSLIGNTNHAISASPAPVRTARSLSPSARSNRSSPKTKSDTPSPSVIPFLELMPDTAITAPRAIRATVATQRRRPPRRTTGSGRSRIAETMFMRLTREAENASTARVRSTPMV